MNDKIVQTVVDHLLERSIDGAAGVIEALANRLGSKEIRRHLDAYDAARQEADDAEKKKFGPFKLFSKWVR